MSDPLAAFRDADPVPIGSLVCLPPGARSGLEALAASASLLLALAAATVAVALLFHFLGGRIGRTVGDVIDALAFSIQDWRGQR